MAKISGALVVYNEQKVIRRALENLQRFCDEIIVFDSFSTDDTVNIANQYGCRIFQHAFDNHRDQKNRAIIECKNEWVFLIDADEYCSNQLVNNLNTDLTDKLNAEGIDALGLPRFNLSDGHGPEGWPDIQTRLFKQYCRHIGHPIHHETTGNANKPVIVMDNSLGVLFHDKTSERQRRQNRMYYQMRPGDYPTPPDGAEGIQIDTSKPANRLDINIYEEYIKPNLNNNINQEF